MRSELIFTFLFGVKFMISKEIEIEFNSLVTSQKNFHDDHSGNVAMYTRSFVEELNKEYPSLNLSDTFLKQMELAALIHDIGKLSIPIHILSKVDSLTENEYKIIQQHPRYGLKYIKQLLVHCQTKEDYDFVKICRNVILYHHERLDGSGYVEGLKGNQIPLEAKILAIIDSFDAMTCVRCYKPAMSKKEAIESLLKENHKYDKKLLKVFKRSLEKLREI